MTFPADRGAPVSAVFEQLTDFRDNSDPGIRYFSGIATYTKEVQIPEGPVNEDGQLWLDLGQVYNLAEVWVNWLIGDAQPDVKEKITFTTRDFYRADSPLVPSGLLGPVKIMNSHTN